MRIPRPQLNYANVIATVALFVALGGAAVAAGLPKNSVGPRQLKKGAVTTKALHRKAVTSGKIAPQAVTAGKLGPFAVLPGNLGNGIITTNKLNNGAVTTVKLEDGAVNNPKLADGSLTPAKFAPGTMQQLRAKVESGETLRGLFDLGSEGKVAREGITFQFPLTNPPAATETNILAADGTSASCPGLKGANGQTPEAAPGQLCVYVKSTSGSPTVSFDDEAVSRLGFGLKAKFGSADEGNRAFGYWAVTAP